eukprot:49949_1
MGVRDYNDKFMEWCEENDYDTETLGDDLNQENAGDVVALEFDEDTFPLPLEDDQKEVEKLRRIYNIVKKCWDHTDAYLDDHKTIASVNKLCKSATFKLPDKQKEQYAKLYSDLTPAIYHSGTAKDDAFLTALIVGRLNRVEYLQHLFDLYMRASVEKYKEDEGVLSIADWAKDNKYFAKLDSTTSELAQAATKSFSARICPRLLFNTTTRIQDSLEDTIRYIWTAAQLVKKLAHAEEDPTCPFQLDLCFAFPKTKSAQRLVELAGGDKAEEQDDDDEPMAVADGDDDEKKKGEFYDQFGDIPNKLESNNIPFIQVPVNHEEDDMKQTRVLATAYEQLVKKVGIDWYPMRRRFVTIIDRREVDKDEITMYEPPRRIRDIPNGAVPEWYLNASKTSILPNTEYKPYHKLVQEAEKEQREIRMEKDEEVGNDFNISSLSSCNGALMTLSFIVKQSDAIKAYLYVNGQICRFFGEDVLDILPTFFDKEFGTNAMFEKGADQDTDDMKAMKEMMEEIKGALHDREYKAFKRVWEREEIN